MNARALSLQIARLAPAIIVIALFLAACNRKEEGPRDTTRVVLPPPPAPPKVTVAGGRPLTFTLDSIPRDAMRAIMARYPAFKPHAPGDYPEAARRVYRASADDGLSLIRATLSGGQVEYAVAGTTGTGQAIVAVIQSPNGWAARPIASSGSPPFSPWMTVSRRRHAHPNRKWDAVVVKILDPRGAYEDVYWWNPKDRGFYLGGSTEVASAPRGR